jgi:UDP-N-acetylglucosamine 2-epimerase
LDKAPVMRKVMTILGTRPELIKMSRVIAALDRNFDHVLVHTGQNFDPQLNAVFYDDLGIRQPDHWLDVAGATAVETIAAVMTRTDALLKAETPEAVLIYGDTNSGLACIPAKRRKIPIFHMEAGNRCFDARVPEEINRKIIDHTADINMVLTEHARRYLLDEAFPADRLFKVGSHMPEVLDYAKDGIGRSDVLARLGLAKNGYFLISAHREENVDDPVRLAQLLASLERLQADHNLPVLFSTHPRTRARLEALGNTAIEGVTFAPPFGFLDYMRLQLDAYCVVSDSGTIAEEAGLMGLCAVTIRDAHERPEGQDAGAVVLSDANPDHLVQAVAVARRTHLSRAPELGRVPDYDGGQVSAKVVRIVAGYIDYVNRTVWRKGES